jgi:hypothetical protein
MIIIFLFLTRSGNFILSTPFKYLIRQLSHFQLSTIFSHFFHFLTCNDNVAMSLARSSMYILILVSFYSDM